MQSDPGEAAGVPGGWRRATQREIQFNRKVEINAALAPVPDELAVLEAVRRRADLERKVMREPRPAEWMNA